MSIQKEKRAVFLGKTGTVTMTIELISRDDLAKRKVDLDRATGGKAMSLTELMKAGQKSLTLSNPYTGEEEQIALDTLVGEFKCFDLDNSFVSIGFKFQADREGPPLYPSDMADELRRRGFPEEQLQELIEWEKTVRKPD